MNIQTFAKPRADPEQLAGKLLADLRSVIDDIAEARNDKELWSQFIKDADGVEECADLLNDISCEICIAADPSLAA